MLSEALKIPYKPVTRLENMCATGSEAMRNAAYAVASGAYDLVMAIGVEKLKDSGYSGLTGSRPAERRHALEHDRARDVLAARAGVRQEVRRRRGAAEAGAGAHRLEEPQERREEPEGAVPQGSADRDDLQVAARSPACSASSTARASATARRRRSSAAPRTRTSTRKHPIFIKALSFAAGPAEGYFSQDYDFTTFPEVVASSQDAYKQAGREGPARRDQHGRGARLLHADRAGADGGHGLLAARAGLEGRAGRPLRRRRPAAGQSRRRAEELRPPDRRQRACA